MFVELISAKGNRTVTWGGDGAVLGGPIFVARPCHLQPNSQTCQWLPSRLYGLVCVVFCISFACLSYAVGKAQKYSLLQACSFPLHEYLAPSSY